MMLVGVGFWPGCIIATGKNNKEAPVIVSCHQTFLDGIILGYLIDPVPAPLTSVDEMGNPLITLTNTTMKGLLVNRNDKDSRKIVQQNICNRCDQYSRSRKLKHQTRIFNQLVIFPEGMTHNSNSILTFKAGAFNPMCPIQPVAIN